MATTTELTPIKKLVLDAGTTMRAFTRSDVVDDYAEKMTNGDKFPAVDAFEVEKRLILVDGFNRIAAATKNGFRDFDVKVHWGKSMEDALVYAAGCNHKHGLQRTREDKIVAVKALLTIPGFAEKSNRVIAEMANVSDPFVGTVRETVFGKTEDGEQQKRAGKDGKTRTTTRRKQARKGGKASGNGNGKAERQAGDDTEAKQEGKGEQGAEVFDAKRFNADVGTLLRHLDQLARDFGHTHKNGTIKETLEHKGLRRQLEEFQTNVAAWRKQLAKELKESEAAAAS